MNALRRGRLSLGLLECIPIFAPRSSKHEVRYRHAHASLRVAVDAPGILVALLLIACSSSQRAEPEETPREVDQQVVEAQEQEQVEQEQIGAPAEFVTVAELWAPDESAVLGVVVSMREMPSGRAADFVMPTGDHDPGDGFAVLFGARLIREGAEVISATTEETRRSFEISRSALPGPVQIWSFDDASLSAVVRLEPCRNCDAWRSPPTRFLIVLTEGQALSATPEPGWTIAISP